MAADLTITSPLDTRTLTLATTVKKIRIDAAVYGQISGLLVHCGSAAGFQILDDGAEPVSSVAPTADYMPITAGAYVPIESAIHGAGGDFWIGVWAGSGTPLLHVRPVPIGR